VCRLGIRDKKMAETLRDSRRKNEFITSRHIPIDIYEGENEVRGKSVKSPLRKDNKNQAQGYVMQL